MTANKLGFMPREAWYRAGNSSLYDIVNNYSLCVITLSTLNLPKVQDLNHVLFCKKCVVQFVLSCTTYQPSKDP